ncbi:MAG: hypothetical protein GY853_14405 [PVC group bacterium]|nr:hypothetical protein [PVC group bacterium]
MKLNHKQEYHIKIPSKEISRIVQKELFERGYGWNSLLDFIFGPKKKYFKHYKMRYPIRLFLENNRISWDNDYSRYIKNPKALKEMDRMWLTGTEIDVSELVGNGYEIRQ